MMLTLLKKILLTPISWTLRLMLGLTAFVVSLSSSLLSVAATIFVLMAILMFFIGSYSNAYALLALAALASPLGLPALAKLLLDGFDWLLGKITAAMCL